MATSSNLRELISAAVQACAATNQLSNRCLAMLIPPNSKRGGGGGGVAPTLTKAGGRKTDQFAISWDVALTTKVGHEASALSDALV